MKRIIGIDIARALAIFGMVFVHFKLVFGGDSTSFLGSFVELINGKSAATFVVLAGVGISILHKKIDTKKLRWLLIKRSLFLFSTGVLFSTIWQADILHNYSIYILLSLFILSRKSSTVLIFATIIICLYPIALNIWDYEYAWDFVNLNYIDFWTASGFFRNLFFNGYNPVFPWLAFMFFGIWFGRKDLTNHHFLKKSLLISSVVFISIQLVSLIIVSETKHIYGELAEQLFGTTPMPPLPFYMISGISFSITTISCSILLGNKFSSNKLITRLQVAGQYALTLYISHILFGVGIIEVFVEQPLGSYPILFSFVYATVFCCFSILFTHMWSQKLKRGPLEFLLRKLTK